MARELDPPFWEQSAFDLQNFSDIQLKFILSKNGLFPEGVCAVCSPELDSNIKSVCGLKCFFSLRAGHAGVHDGSYYL